MENSIFTKIQKDIDQKGENSPFLFLWENMELIHADIESFIKEIFIKYAIDSQSLFHLVDSWEVLKIDEIKKFLANGNTKPRFKFQIFFIENISRMTLQSANACLKFFEEPGEGNIIFLTNASESWVLETILSRVQIISYTYSQGRDVENNFYISMIESHVLWSSDELVRYFFSGKYEKWEYTNFLKSIIYYISKTGDHTHLLDELHEDIWGILKNNLQGKYIADKYIMLLKG